MTDRVLVDLLASLVYGWRPGPDRFSSSDRSWRVRSRFSPLTDIKCAFDLLDAVGARFTIVRRTGTDFSVEVWIGDRRGHAQYAELPRAVSVAIAAALGLLQEPPCEKTTGVDGRENGC